MHRSGRKVHTGPARAASIYVVLVANKCMHVAALYWVVHVLTAASLPTTVMACWVLATATAVALVLKRPWQQKLVLPRRTHVRLLGNGVVIALCVVAVLHAARTAGAFRAAIIGGVDSIAIGTMSGAVQSGLCSRKGRGLLLALAGLCLVAWPSSVGYTSITANREANATAASHPSTLAAEDEAIGGTDVMWASALLVVAAIVASARRAATRRLAVDLGGRKRCHTLSLAVATCVTFPLAVYNAATWSEPTNGTNGYATFSLGVVLSAGTMGLFAVVLGEYMQGVVMTKLRQPLAANVSLAATALSCGVLTLAGSGWSDFAATGVLGVAVLALGTSMLVGAARERARPSFGAGGLGAADALALPLYDGGDPDDSDPNRSRVALTFRIRRIVRHILDDKDSRKIFFFLAVNLMFMFVELVVGWWTNSLGLISDAGHMFFDNASLFIGLYASYMAKWRKDDIFTYGYGRYEVLAGFVNAIFLVFVGFSVVLEGLERLFTPPEIHGDHLLTVAVGGLLVNLIGIFFFAEAHGGHGHSHGGHGHSHGNDNMEGIFLHVLADTLGSVGVIVSSLLIQYKGWYWSDAGASLFISALILLSVIPLVRNTASVLLSGTPPGYDEDLRNCFVQIASLEGVMRVWKPHAWKLRSDYCVVTLHIQVTEDADEQSIKEQATMLLKRCGCTDVTLQVEKKQFLQRMSAGSDILHATEPLTFHRGMAQAVPQVDHAAHHGHGGHGHSHGAHGHAHAAGSSCSAHHHVGVAAASVASQQGDSGLSSDPSTASTDHDCSASTLSGTGTSLGARRVSGTARPPARLSVASTRQHSLAKEGGVRAASEDHDMQ